MRGRASDRLSPHQAQSKCAPLIIRTEDLSAARSHMSYAQKLRLPQAQDREATESYLPIPLFLSLSLSLISIVLPRKHSTGPPLVAPTRSSVPPPPPLSLLLFRRYIFCSHRERSVVRATSNGLPHLSLFRLPSKRCPPLPSPLVPLRPESLSSGIRRL